MRQSPKSRIKPFLREQRKQRRTTLDLNLGARAARALTDVFAIKKSLKKLGFYPNKKPVYCQSAATPKHHLTKDPIKVVFCQKLCYQSDRGFQRCS